MFATKRKTITNEMILVIFDSRLSVHQFWLFHFSNHVTRQPHEQAYPQPKVNDRHVLAVLSHEKYHSHGIVHLTVTLAVTYCETRQYHMQHGYVTQMQSYVVTFIVIILISQTILFFIRVTLLTKCSMTLGHFCYFNLKCRLSVNLIERFGFRYI